MCMTWETVAFVAVGGAIFIGSMLAAAYIFRRAAGR